MPNRQDTKDVTDVDGDVHVKLDDGVTEHFQIRDLQREQLIPPSTDLFLFNFKQFISNLFLLFMKYHKQNGNYNFRMNDYF